MHCWQNKRLQNHLLTVRFLLFFPGLSTAALPRSKSTPGLLESTGQVSLETMIINRHNTLPSGVLNTRRGSSQDGSHCTVHSDPGGSTSQPRSGSHHSGSYDDATNDSCAAMHQAASADITHSMTVSSITSYISESSAQNSSAAMETAATRETPSEPQDQQQTIDTTNRASAPHSQNLPPCQSSGDANDPGGRTQPVHASGGLLGAPSTRLGSEYYQADGSSDCVTYAGGQIAFCGSPQGLPVVSAQMSPFHKLYPGSPVIGRVSLVSPGQLPHAASGNAAQTLGYGTSPLAPPSHPTPGSPTLQGYGRGGQSLSPVPGVDSGAGSDLLLQEIQRLRQRLQTLETENATMHARLSHKNWEVESRLAEIEMHICGSDSGSGNEDSNGSTVLSKESVI